MHRHTPLMRQLVWAQRAALSRAAAAYLRPSACSPHCASWIANAARALSSDTSAPSNTAVLSLQQVRLIGADGKNRGVIASREALNAAKAENLDLVQANAGADPPVWRLVPKDQAVAVKAAATAREQAHEPDKEVRLTLGVADHDLATKVRNVHKFLDKGLSVRLVFRPPRRPLPDADSGTLLERIMDMLGKPAPTRKYWNKDAKGKVTSVTLLPPDPPSSTEAS